MAIAATAVASVSAGYWLAAARVRFSIDLRTGASSEEAANAMNAALSKGSRLNTRAAVWMVVSAVLSLLSAIAQGVAG